MNNLHRFLFVSILVLFFYSCSTSSSASEELHSDATLDSYTYLSSEAIVYASSISNLVATFPTFRNDAVNKEINGLKIALTDYLIGIRNFDATQKQKSLNSFESRYKAIQKLRKNLNTDDDEVLNRYLVKIKTNMNLLESSLTKTKEDSDSSN